MAKLENYERMQKYTSWLNIVGDLTCRNELVVNRKPNSPTKMNIYLWV